MDLFVLCFNHSRTPTERFPENFVKIQLDLAEIFRIEKCLFVYLLVYGIVCFLFNNLGTPTGRFPENFVKIRLDLAEILRFS